tara:strand:- start:1333 stop:1494 length:162 start_codon:yes stop_codon:yes gene_type:complete
MKIGDLVFDDLYGPGIIMDVDGFGMLILYENGRTPIYIAHSLSEHVKVISEAS